MPDKALDKEEVQGEARDADKALEKVPGKARDVKNNILHGWR